MKASMLLVKALENEGVDYIFGVPGEENLDFLESLRNSDKIKFVLTRHEQGAGFMAATHGRLTGRPGVCLATLGPGATNLVTPAAYAQLGAMPIVMITGQKPIKKGGQGKFQIIDVNQMMRPITKYTEQVTHAVHIPVMVREAFRLAIQERQGAVHIELPEDIAQEDVPEPNLFGITDETRPIAGPQIIDIAMEMIMKSRRPLLLIGAGANREGTSEALTNFVDKTGIFFFNTQMGKGIVDERNPLYLGTAAMTQQDYLHEAIDCSDLIINVGHDVVEKPPFAMSHTSARRVIHINFFHAELDEVYFPHLNVIGDISATLDRLTESVMGNMKEWETDIFHTVRDKIRTDILRFGQDNRFPILPQCLVKVVREVLEDDDIVTLDNGIYKVWFARNYPTYVRNGLILDNALATMGAGLPSAIMAKELNPDKKVVSVNGDGGFMMNSQELETAIRLGTDIVVIVLNDGAYGMIKWKQKGEGFPGYGLEYTNPDFVKYAKSFGATGYRPSSVKEFKDMLSIALDSNGVQIIDLPVDYSLNHELLTVS